jgi:plastocyanin
MVNASDAGQTFRGQCAELCGVGHSIMLFDVRALSATEFDAWLAEKVKSNPPPAPSGAAPSGATPSGAAPSGATPSGGPAPSGATPSGTAPSGAAPSGGAAGATVKISAKGISYQESAITAAAGQPFKIEFDNEDAGTPHNVSIHQGPASGTEVFKGEIFPGVATKTYDVPALTAGSYTFACTVHPSMTGTLTVQ